MIIYLKKTAGINYLIWTIITEFDSAAPILYIRNNGEYKDQEKSRSYDKVAVAKRHC